MDILVLSRNPALYSTQSIVNAGRNRGHYVRVIDHMQCDLVIEQNVPQIYYQNERIQGINAIIPRIGSSVTSYGHAVIRQFESMNVFSTLSSEALLRARDKISCLQILAADGIDVPKSVVSNNPFVIPEILEKIEKYPKIIKLANGTHGLGVILSENRQNAESILEAFSKIKEKVIIQEFIREAKGRDLRIFLVENEVVGVMERVAEDGDFRSNLHRGATARVIKPSDEEVQLAKRASKLLGLKVAGVDMLRSQRGPLILEVNASPGLEGIETTTQINIAGRIIQYIERNASAKWRRK